MIALWGMVIAALIAAVLAPWVKDRIDTAHDEEIEQKAERATLATVTEDRVAQLFREQDRLRSAYRSDIDDLRGQLRESAARVQLLEHEVAEWRAGVRGVVGVWVAVPAHVWDFVRDNLPDLPPTRFPGERDAIGGLGDELE